MTNCHKLGGVKQHICHLTTPEVRSPIDFTELKPVSVIDYWHPRRLLASSKPATAGRAFLRMPSLCFSLFHSERPLRLHWAHPDHPGSPPRCKILYLVTSAKSLLPWKVTYSQVPGSRTWTPGEAVTLPSRQPPRDCRAESGWSRRQWPGASEPMSSLPATLRGLEYLTLTTLNCRKVNVGSRRWEQREESKVWALILFIQSMKANEFIWMIHNLSNGETCFLIEVTLAYNTTFPVYNVFRLLHTLRRAHHQKFSFHPSPYSWHPLI